MSLPGVVLGIVFSTLYGALFHLVRGGSLLRLFLYIFLSWIGFWLGHWVGEEAGWIFLSIGTLRLGMATIGSLLVIALGYWLSLATPVESKK
jgi:hypothetical protein